MRSVHCLKLYLLFFLFQLRLIMKMHSFVRENIPKVLNFNNKKGIVIFVLFTVIEILPYDNDSPDLR